MNPDAITTTDTGSRYTVTADFGHGTETLTVPGRPVRPGLAITAWLGEDGQISQTPHRYVFTHIPSGRYLGDPLCRACIDIAEPRMTAVDVDWTQPDTTLRADPAVLAVHTWLTNVGDFCLVTCPSASDRIGR